MSDFQIQRTDNFSTEWQFCSGFEIAFKGKNQNVEKQPKRTSKISVFLVHHYYENQKVEKNEKNIENLNFV